MFLLPGTDCFSLSKIEYRRLYFVKIIHIRIFVGQGLNRRLWACSKNVKQQVIDAFQIPLHSSGLYIQCAKSESANNKAYYWQTLISYTVHVTGPAELVRLV